MSARGGLRYATPALFTIATVATACIGEDPPPTQGLRDSGVVTTGDAEPPTVSRSIRCNGDAVCTGNDVCCSANDTWVPRTATCKPTCGAERTIACDDASDCATGQVCCMTTDTGAQAIAAACVSSCSGAQQQLCSSEASECTGGKTCTPLTMFSPSGLSTCK